MQRKFEVGDRVVLHPGTMIWGNEKANGRGGTVYEVVALVDDGMNGDRITVRPIDGAGEEFRGIEAGLFDRAEGR